MIRGTLLLAVAAVSLQAQAPLTIEGLNHRQYPGYANSVTFRVPSTAGYSYNILLDTNPVPTDASVTVNSVDYHELLVWRTNTSTLQTTNRRIQFIVKNSTRGTTEEGIPTWTPYPTIPSASNEFLGARLRIIAPESFPAGYQMPVVAWVGNADGKPLRANGELRLSNGSSLMIRRGAGSALLPAQPAGTNDVTFAIGGIETNKTVGIEGSTAWTSVSGVLAGNVTWPENARILATAALTVPVGATLTIRAGTIVRLNSRVDITNNGTILIEGTADRPVVLMPNSPAQPWGGFVMRDGTGTIDATGAIFTGSGAEPTWFGANGNPGSHRREQGLFYVDDDQAITLNDCAAIYLAGQLGHSRAGGEFVFNRFLLQRSTTGGEYTGANFTVNDSAFIEAPAETPEYVDGDNDLLYLVSGRHGFTNTLFGWCKDDGIDSGASGSGVFNYENCWFEGAFHEGNSLSGNGKDVRHRNGVFINCGQGLEAGYDGPTGRLDHCFVTANVIGGRFGDNYDWDYGGFLRVTNSLLIHNHRDVWGYNWDDWTYRTAQMDVRSNLLTVPDAFHPSNAVWNPLTDAQWLADFMSAPVGTEVGIGIATWTSQFALRELSNAVPVRLSTFTTVPVTVNYSIDTADQGLASGALEFQPGETVKFIRHTTPLPSDARLVRVSLGSAENAEISGRRSVIFFDPPAPLLPRGSVWKYRDLASDPGQAWRNTNYNDTAWPSGPAQLGFSNGEEDDEATLITNNSQITSYFRRSITVDDPGAYTSVSMWLLRDDAGVVYFNGQEVFRSPNLPAFPAAIGYGTTSGSPNGENTVDTATFSAAILNPGINWVAVEIHQQGPTSSDVSFDFELVGVPAQNLQLLQFGPDRVLFWTDATYQLQSAPEVSGPWSNVTGATSPYDLAPSAGAKFYRLRR